MIYNFDTPVHRRGTGSEKWSAYPPDVLPLWVADMDFRSPEPVLQALHNRVQHGVFGYADQRPKGLIQVLQERLLLRHGWRVRPESIQFVPGLVPGMNIAMRAACASGDGIALTTPIYPPFLASVAGAGGALHDAELAMSARGSILRYELDFDALEAAVTPRTRLFILCNPHNPIGRAYTRRELEQVAEFCLRHDLLICSDEIHCDLLLGDVEHTSIATLGPEVARRCITLLAPSKTFNLPGLGCGVLIAEEPELVARVQRTIEGIVPYVNVLGFVAAEAAYREGQPWLDQLLPYLRGNRETLTGFVASRLPGVRVTEPDGSYLGWLDCRQLNLPDGQTPHAFFLESAKVALKDGAEFGRGGEGFVRLNFGCTRGLLVEALERMAAALEQVQ